MPVPLRMSNFTPTAARISRVQKKRFCKPLVEQLEVREMLASLPMGGAISSTSQAPQILLTPSALSAVQRAAQLNTPQWQAFQSKLGQNLGVVIGSGYQASNLALISDYALGYEALKSSDPLTAAKYADKAIGILKSGLHDYQKGDWSSRQFLARGDGSTRSFTLPNSDYLPTSLKVYLAPVSTTAVTRGAVNGQDSVDYYQIFLKASNSPDGTPDYLPGVDWQRDGDYGNDMIDWSLPGKEPPTGSTYYVTEASDYYAVPTSVTVNGSTITLASAPTTDQAVFVEYVYGTHAADGSTLAYQQTGASDGGFDSIFVDTTYSSRFLGKHIAMGLDWLDGYAGLTDSLKLETINMLERWYNFERVNGYYATSPASNYGAGGYVSDAFTALALSGRTSDASAYLNDIVSYRQTYLLPLLQNSMSSLKGGFWAEGWNYGALAVQNVLLAALALEANGQILAAPERAWSTEVIQQLISDQASMTTIYDGGDGYAYPLPFPSKDMVEVLAASADDAPTRAYANYILQNYPGAFPNTYLDVLFRDSTAATAFWSGLPLQNLATGTGLMTARSDWSNTPTWVSVQIGNLLAADHQTYAPGQVQIQRGADDLLVNANAVGKYQNPNARSQFGNTIVVDDNGDGSQVYRWSMGSWYGTPGVVINAYEARDGFVYLTGDYHAAYSLNTDPGGGGSTSELTREVVYLRPDVVVVYDRVTTVKDTYPKQQRWHFLNAPTISGNAFVETVGTSKLFGETFSSVPLTTTVAPVEVGDGTVQELITQNGSPTATVRYVTAFQTAPSSLNSMNATQRIVSADSRMEGAEIGNQVVLFGRDGDVDPATPVTYQVSANGTVSHLLTDLIANRPYQVMVNGQLWTNATASSQGTLSFTTTGSGTQIIAVTAGQTAASIVNVTSTNANGAYTTGSTIDVTVAFSAVVTVAGTPQLQLETGATDRFANYVSGSGTSALTFNYTIQPGDNSTHLDYTTTSSLGLNGGAITNAFDSAAILTLPIPGTPGSLGSNRQLIVDTIPPTISGVTTFEVQTATATVVWTTNEPADSLVEYGPSTSYGSSSLLNTDALSNHDVILTGLIPGATYHYRVESTDAAGNLAISGDFLLTTQALVKFSVVNDGTLGATYQYDASGRFVQSHNLVTGNAAPRGAASAPDGSKMWIVDKDRDVYVYDYNGAFLGVWTAGGSGSKGDLEGIATNGTDIWVVDAKSDRVFRYSAAATRLSGTLAASSSFQLAAGNGHPTGIVTDGASLWIVDAGKPGKVFKYNLTGGLLGRWTIDNANGSPTGITIDPANVQHVWIVDDVADKVFQYSSAAARISGGQLADAVFGLAPGNSNPQDISDPPAVIDWLLPDKTIPSAILEDAGRLQIQQELTAVPSAQLLPLRNARSEIACKLPTSSEIGEGARFTSACGIVQKKQSGLTSTSISESNGRGASTTADQAMRPRKPQSSLSSHKLVARMVARRP